MRTKSDEMSLYLKSFQYNCRILLRMDTVTDCTFQARLISDASTTTCFESSNEMTSCRFD